ncbi:MAG TPA: hemolysin family protein [Bacteroidia bacterium]|nr:hemolysin family protein [Bacteroidia bacterium]
MISDILITFFLVFLNGFFVAAEFAIVKVRTSQLEISIQSGNRAARLARHITDHLDGYLAATQLGITLASLGLGWIGEPVVSKLIIKVMVFFGISISPELAHDIALPFAFAVITVLHIVFGELAPKSIAIQRSQKTTLYIAYPLQFFYLLFKPFIWVLNGIANFLLKLIGISSVHGSEVHSHDELKYLIRQGKESGAIEASDYDIIRNAFDFSERIAKQIMVPRTHVMAIDLNDFDDEKLQRIIEENYSRIPCYEDDLDNIIGVVYLKDILLRLRKNEPANVRELMRTIMTVPETKRIGRLLKDFQIKHQQIAVVINEYGGTTGIITMEDILEELVGEIQDEFDKEIPVVEKVGDKSFTVIASASIDDINKLLPHPITKEEEYLTLAGNLIFRFGRIPNSNEKIIFDDFEFTVLKKSRNTITLVQIHDLR